MFDRDLNLEELARKHCYHASPSLEDAIKKSSRSISSNLIGKSGIQRLRVLSETKFNSLIADLVEQKIRNELRHLASKEREDEEAESRSALEIPLDDEDGLPIVILDDDDEEELPEQVLDLWSSFQEEQESKFSTIETRMEGLGNTFRGLKNSVRLLQRAVGKDQE